MNKRELLIRISGCEQLLLIRAIAFKQAQANQDQLKIEEADAMLTESYNELVSLRVAYAEAVR